MIAAEVSMLRPLFHPSLRQIAWLAALTAAALAYALYLRHLVIEQPSVGIACQSGMQSWLCTSRRIAIGLFTPSVFGIVAIGAALLNLVRPTFILCAIALVAAGFGVVLYNVALSALAVALLILSLARPAPEPE
jgi:hypothetical protein